MPSLRIACAPRFPDAHLRVELLCAHQMGASSFRFLFNQAREDYLLVIFRARSRSSRTLDDQVQSHSSPGQLSSLSSAFPANGAHNTHSRDEGAERFLQRRIGKVRWFRRGPAGILQGAKQGGGAGFSQRWVSWRQWRKFWKGPKRESGCSPGLQAFDYGVVRGGRGSRGETITGDRPGCRVQGAGVQSCRAARDEAVGEERDGFECARGSGDGIRGLQLQMRAGNGFGWGG